MSSAKQLLRERRRQAARPFPLHRPKAQYVAATRAVALTNLATPGMDQDGLDSANELLEMVGDLLTSPRSGWYPQRPRRRRAGR